ncbi:MAG: DUF5693 family protein [Synergistaceae bacterium]|nr:DUF5693 family protein [Synergistaceae bacterium]
MFLTGAFIFACSVIALLPRLALESDNRDAAIIVDYRDIIPLAEEAGISNVEALIFLRDKGVRGLMVSEFTSSDVEYAIPPDFTGPDYGGLKDGSDAGLCMFYRIAPAQTWQLRQSLETVEQILGDYPQITLAAPTGDVAIGFPDMTLLASLLKEHSVSVAQIEFSRQLGASQLNWLAFPNLIPLHSVTYRELTARRISRQTLHERLARAAIERSVRILVLRPAVSGNVESSLASFGQEVESLANRLESRGLTMDWPKPLFNERSPWRMSFISALACSMAFVLPLARYVKRVNGRDKDNINMADAALLEAFGQAGRAQGQGIHFVMPATVGDDEFHAAAADVDDQARLFPEIEVEGHPGVNQAGFLHPGDDLDPQAGLLFDPLQKKRAVFGLADGGGGYGPDLVHLMGPGLPDQPL